jgi:hypothetical protein
MTLKELKSLPRKNSSELDVFMLNFLKLVHKTDNKEMLPNLFYKANIALLSKLDSDTMEKENYRPISLTNNKLNKILANQIQQYIKKIIHHYQVGFIPWI